MTLPIRSLILILLAAIWISAASITAYTYKNPVADKIERENNNAQNGVINDVTGLNPVKVKGIVVPHDIEEIASIIKSNDHISVGGGRNSMGGQTASERAVQIDLREYNKVISFSPENKEITVQSGIRWRDIQDYIDPSNLSIKIMQTYANFTVGGSLSVNVHGRYIGLGPVILSVKKIKVVLADGSIVEASPEKNSDIFYGVIGGLGGVGVICEVTLTLADNVNLERSRTVVSTDSYWDFFAKNVRSNSGVVFHNGDLYPPYFDAVSAVSWSVTDKEPTVSERLIPRNQKYWLDRIVWIVMSDWYGGKWIRRHIVDPLIYMGNAPVHTRNYEASYDIAELEPESRDKSTYVLQEYFVPIENFKEWVPKMRKVFLDNDVNVINVSIRHSLPDPGAKLAWARKESFAFVVYYKQDTTREARDQAAKWTREMIDQVLSVNGTYYLPYQPHATDYQFQRAYPGAIEYFEIKNKYDPSNKFTNKLWDKYYSKEKLEHYKMRKNELELTASIKDYLRPFDNAYLTIPEWHIVFAADEYATTLKDGLPSDFDYLQTIRNYWNQHSQVIKLTETSGNNNDDYKTVLKVIGWSFAIENYIKWGYENTIGKASEFVSGNTQVPEDKYAAKAAELYAKFIYDYPWYDFPYFSYLKGLWNLEDGKNCSIGQQMRRVERKIILSLEFAVKTLYSKAIAYATHQKFGVQDDIVHAVITRDGGKTREVISAAHYQPFTRMLLSEFEKELHNQDFSLIDVAGNEKITLCYHDESGAPVIGKSKEVLRIPEVIRINKGEKEFKDRLIVEVEIKDAFLIFKNLRNKNIHIEHFYDY